MAAAVMQHPPEAPRDAGRLAQAAARHGRLRRQTSRIDESDNDCLIVCLEHWLEQLKLGELDPYAVPYLGNVAGVSAKAYSLVKSIAALLPGGDQSAWQPAIVLQGIKTILSRARDLPGAVPLAVQVLEAPWQGGVTAPMVAQLEKQIGTSASDIAKFAAHMLKAAGAMTAGSVEDKAMLCQVFLQMCRDPVFASIVQGAGLIESIERMERSVESLLCGDGMIGQAGIAHGSLERFFYEEMLSTLHMSKRCLQQHRDCADLLRQHQ